MKYNFDEIINRDNNNAAKYVERLKKFGRADVIPLWVADMDFKTAQPVIDALVEKAKQGIFGYTSRPASYFKAVCSWQQKRHGWTINPDMLSFTVGIVPAMSAVVMEFTKPSDKVLIQTPVYSEFYDVIEAWDREVVENPLLRDANGYSTIDFADFELKLQQVSLFLLCSLHNPVGRVWHKDELEKMLSLCKNHGVLVLSDEIHSDFVFKGHKHIPTALIDSNVISCVSASKTFNLAGLQAATVVFPNLEYKKRFDDLWGKFDIHRNNSFSVVATEVAMTEGEEWLDQLLVYLEGNFRYVHEYFQKHIPQIKSFIPESTYLMWLDCSGLGLNDEQLNQFFIDKAGLGLNAGKAYGRSLSGFMRMNLACPRSVLEKVLKQLDAAVQALKR